MEILKFSELNFKVSCNINFFVTGSYSAVNANKLLSKAPAKHNYDAATLRTFFLSRVVPERIAINWDKRGIIAFLLLTQYFFKNNL